MNKIKIPDRKASLPVQLAKSQEIITKSTNNPDVPGNATPLNDFSTATTAVSDAYVAVQTAEAALKSARIALKQNEALWIEARALLAAFTEAATSGDAEKILTTGFDVRNSRTPQQPVSQVLSLRVQLNGMAGNTKLSWDPQPHADSFIIQSGTDPNDLSTFQFFACSADSRFEGAGSEPGKVCYFRVAAVNRLGTGPWSAVGARPVM